MGRSQRASRRAHRKRGAPKALSVRIGIDGAPRERQEAAKRNAAHPCDIVRPCGSGAFAQSTRQGRGEARNIVAPETALANG